MQKKIISIILFILATFNCCAQHFAVRRLSSAQGLSSNYVNSIAEDKDGYIWAATEEGLNRFDGNSFTCFYNNNQQPQLSGNELNHILDDPKDSIIWIATQRAGLNAYNYHTNTMKHYGNGMITSEAVTDIAPSADSSIWVATYWDGINYLDKKTGSFRQYNSQNVPGINSSHIWTIADGKDGKVYLGYSDNGMAILDTASKSLTFMRHDPKDNATIPSDDVLCIRIDNYGSIWVGTAQGLAVYNPHNQKFTRIDFIEPLRGRSVFDICHANDGSTWIALELGGIVVIDRPQSPFASPKDIRCRIISAGEGPNSLSGASVRCIYQDRHGNIWAGIWAGGINFISKNRPYFGYIDATPDATGNSLNNRGVLSTAIDGDHKLYIGTDGGGINIFQRGKRIAVYNSENTPQIANNSIQALYYDGDGGIWVGMFNAGLAYMDTRTARFATVIEGDGGEVDIRHIAPTSGDTLLVSSSGGVYVVSKSRKKPLGLVTLTQNLTRCALRDHRGNIWVGTFGGGLFVLDVNMQAIRHLEKSNGFPSNTVNHILTTTHGDIYVATGEGLVKFKTASDTAYSVYNMEDGMANIHIRAIAEDSLGNIWFSTNKGISCLTDDRKIQNFDTRDGICEGSYTSASVCRSKHSIFFGSINGVSVVHPDDALRHIPTPTPRITKIIIASSSPQLGDSIIHNPRGTLTLDHEQNTLIIGINTCDYDYTPRAEHECKLVGFDDKWIDVNNADGTITFRNLPPGRYKVKIRSHLRNQDWDNETTAITLRIKPPLWQTPWAKALYFILIIAAATAMMKGYKRRVKMKALYDMERNNREKDNNLNEERLKFYTNITHELRTPLTLIMGPIEDLANDKTIAPETAAKVSLIHRNTQNLLQKVNTLLDFRKTETQNKQLTVSKGKVSDVISDMVEKYRQLVSNHAVPIAVAINPTDEMLFDKDALQTIVNNLISNAIKYTSKGTITIGTQQIKRNGKDFVEITVADTGRGISADALPHIFERYYQEHGDHQSSGTGIGLALVKNLVDLHHAQIEVESRKGKGSVFRVYFDVHETYPEAIHISETPNADETTPNATATLPSTRKLVLIVEDNHDILNYISTELSKDYDTATAENGKLGLDEAFSRTPDIIISDIMMPVMNGTDFCRRIKNDIRTSHIPVILLTAKDSMDDKEHGYNAGADSYLTKPFTATLLRSRINNLLESRKKLASRFVLPSNATTALSSTPDIAADTIRQKHEAYMSQLSKLDQEFIDKVNTIISDNLDEEKLDTPFIASQMALSISTLYRKMKSLTGLTASDYIRKARMQRAEQLLLEGKYSISEVAYMVGINSNVHFRQCFKDEYGMLPSEYIKQIRKE